MTGDARILVRIVNELIAIVVEFMVGIRGALLVQQLDAAQYLVECVTIDLRQTWWWCRWRVAVVLSSPSLLKVRPRNDFSLWRRWCRLDWEKGVY